MPIIQILIGAIICLAVVIAYMALMIHRLKVRHAENLKRTITTQRSVIKGQIAEQLYPMMPNCKFLPSDMRFIGHPIDFIIFNGYTDAKDDGGDITEIIFADIKTGSATLSAHQRKIKQAIEEKRVRWETIKLPG